VSDYFILRRRLVFLTLLASRVASAATSTPTDIIRTDGYFLTPSNPIATVDQRDTERVALSVLEFAQVKQAKERAVFRWKAGVRGDPPAEAWAMFESSIDEYVFNYVLKAAASDANFPKVVQIYTPPHEWFGVKSPGSRVAGDNPDNSYRIIPIAGDAKYEIKGRHFKQGPADVTFTLVSDYATSKTLASLIGRDLQVGADGTFVITVDPEAAQGRENHIQSTPAALFLFIRDSRSDWRQLPNALQVVRLDPPKAPPLTEQQMAERAAATIVDDVPLVYWWSRLGQGQETNHMTAPFRPGAAAGGLATQVNTNGIVILKDDEAAVLTINPAGAAFRDVVLQDYWYRTIEYWHRTSSMNNSQAIANADGTVTYVISINDPGVHNWLDTGGLHQVLVQHRWQGLPPETADGQKPAIDIKIVKASDLDRSLPADMKRISSAERQNQLSERFRAYSTRWVDR